MIEKKISPQILAIGSGSPVVIVTAAIHGDEPVGIKIINTLKERVALKKGTLKLIVGNPYALEKNVRFLETDLNRVFPGNLDGTMEEQLAAELSKAISSADYVIDIHSCSIPSEPFCIVRSLDRDDFLLARYSGLPNIVQYPLSTQGGASSIDVAKAGVGFELGLHDSQETFEYGYSGVINILTKLQMIEGKMESSNQNVFLVAGHVSKPLGMVLNKDIKNFTLVKKGTVLGSTEKQNIIAQENFYPVLFGERSYKDTVCWIGKKLSV